jgi:hypothetical protein
VVAGSSPASSSIAETCFCAGLAQLVRARIYVSCIFLKKWGCVQQIFDLKLARFKNKEQPEFVFVAQLV